MVEKLMVGGVDWLPIGAASRTCCRNGPRSHDEAEVDTVADAL